MTFPFSWQTPPLFPVHAPIQDRRVSFKSCPVCEQTTAHEGQHHQRLCLKMGYTIVYHQWIKKRYIYPNNPFIPIVYHIYHIYTIVYHIYFTPLVYHNPPGPSWPYPISPTWKTEICRDINLATTGSDQQRPSDELDPHGRSVL
jgi:hypothetical protein